MTNTLKNGLGAGIPSRSGMSFLASQVVIPTVTVIDEGQSSEGMLDSIELAMQQAGTERKGNLMADLTKATQEDLSARQKILEGEIEDNEEEIRQCQAELNEIYAEQDRRHK